MTPCVENRNILFAYSALNSKTLESELEEGREVPKCRDSGRRHAFSYIASPGAKLLRCMM